MKSVLASMCLGVAGYLAVTASVASAGYIEVLNTIAGADKVSYWNLQETDGAAVDAWATGTLDGPNDGTFSGAGYTRGVAGPGPATGFLGFSPSNNAVAFNGDASQLLRMANSASFEGVQSLSLALWFTSGGSGSDRVIGGLHDSNSANTNRYGFLLNSRSSPLRGGARVWDGLSESGGLFTTPALGNRDGDWHFAVLTMAADVDVPTNKRVRIYFDGAEALSSEILGGGTLGLGPRQTSGTDGVLTFGNDLGATDRALIGSIDEIAFVGRALTGAEVASLWDAALSPSSQAGDFDGDGDVDGADFVAWQTNFPLASGATLAQGDADGDGDVDGADFVVWQTNFPFTPAPGAAPVPEPDAAWLLLFGGIIIGGIACRQRRQLLLCKVDV